MDGLSHAQPSAHERIASVDSNRSIVRSTLSVVGPFPPDRWQVLVASREQIWTPLSRSQDWLLGSSPGEGTEPAALRTRMIQADLREN